ncbi:MAG: DMT family transporter [Muribaculaceae bacterium]|nr:DMT family transporter [Muribaculaceae bacterium]
MQKNKIKGNAAMLVSKVFSGLNENALRYLLPAYMSAPTGVFLRVGFGSAFFWLLGLFRRPSVRPTRRQRLGLFAIGLFCVFGYMFFLLKGLTYTTPVSSSIFISLQPVCVFVICLMLGREKATAMKVGGIVLGVAGAVVCVLTQHSSEVASDPLRGNIYCAASTLVYSIYLIISKQYLRTLDDVTVSKWTFLGAAAAALPVALAMGWDAPVLKAGILSAPMLVLLFVLVFPSSVSYLLIDIGLKNLAATVVALYGSVILIVAAGVSYALGQDRFSWWQIVAIALIMVSMYLVEHAEVKEHSGDKVSR